MDKLKSIFGEMDRKKMIMVLGGIIGGLIVLIIIICLLISTFSKNIYSGIEDKLANAARKYYADNQKKLPVEVGSQITITASQLTQYDYFDDLNDVVDRKDVKCTGKVVVTNVNNKYNYTAYLDCGKAYQSTEMKSKITSDDVVVYEGIGVYQLNGEYVYRGENPNNYIKFAGKNWRIVKVDKNENIVLVAAEREIKNAWDDRYNEDRNLNTGINDYNVSRMHDFYVNYYNDEDNFSELNKTKMANFDLCIGKRGKTADINDGSIECGSVLEDQTIGGLPLYDYMNASLDTGCVSSTSKSCENYNYLSLFERSWWTITADDEFSYKVYKIDQQGKPVLSVASTKVYVRPVIYLLSTTMYVSGDGTIDNPYIVK